MKYVSIEELKKEIAKAPVWTGLDAIARINALPSVDLVRCKDCKKKKACVTFEGLANEDGFCSMGERNK